MTVTAYHAKYFAYDLTRRASIGLDRLSMSLFDAAVDLNPHQIEAALFALESPLSKGVLLADEVGLGKTIEAGIVLCQFWAERKRRLLVICPASLRKQWALELSEKFNLPSRVLDAKTYRDELRLGRAPLNEKGILIVSFNYASALREEIKAIGWDLVVIDEAHKLRNAYRPSNKVGQGIRWATEDCRKLLLTATPLQNSLVELYGLSTLIDDHLFGDINAFRARYASAGSSLTDLRQRLATFCKRTLRNQVVEYVRYTERRAITRPFTSSDAEHSLYEAVSAFVGDVTPVGATPPVKGNERAKPGRPLMNSNVAIELGYALRSISDKNVLAVLNLAYGDETGLPFDIKHKRWPIKYQLVVEATSTEIKAQQKVLKDQFVTALRGFISEPPKLESTFAETPPRIGKAFYFEDGQSLGHARQLDLDMYMPFRDVLYLRIIPMKPLVRPLAEQLMVNNVGKYGSFGPTSGGAFLLRNEWGVAAFDPAGHTENIDSILQYFPNGEIWGINADIMRQGNRGDESWYLATTSEHAFAETLFHALEFMKNTSKVELPVRVVAGVVGLKGRRLVVPGTTIGSYGRMMTDSVEYEAILHDDSLEAQDKLLLALFEKIFDQSGQPRPEKLGGFPPDRK